MLSLTNCDRASGVSLQMAHSLSVPSGSYEQPPAYPESVTESGPRYKIHRSIADFNALELQLCVLCRPEYKT